MIDVDNMDDLFKRIERMMDGGFSHMGESQKRKSTSSNKSEILLWEDKLSITIDLSKLPITEIDVYATRDKLIVSTNDIGISYSKEMPLPLLVKPKTLVKTIINGILDIEIDLDKEANDEIRRSEEETYRDGFSTSQFGQPLY